MTGIINPYVFAAAGGSPIRASGILQWSTNQNSKVVTFPAAAQAGDYMVIFSSEGWNTVVPAGWTTINQPSTGANFNGATFAKTLSSGDISTGSVTVTYGGSSVGVLSYVVFIGGVTGVRTSQAVRGSGGVSTRAITTNSSPVAGDYAFYWGSYGGSGTLSDTTIDRGTTLQTTPSANGATGTLNWETLSSSGAFTTNVNYHSAGTGDYSIVLVIQP